MDKIQYVTKEKLLFSVIPIRRLAERDLVQLPFWQYKCSHFSSAAALWQKLFSRGQKLLTGQQKLLTG